MLLNCPFCGTILLKIKDNYMCPNCGVVEFVKTQEDRKDNPSYAN